MHSRHGSLMRMTLGIALMLAFVVGIAANSTSASAGVEPGSYSGELEPGESVTIDKVVDVPESPTKADVYLLADTTGSMGSILSSVKAGAASVISGLEAELGSDVQFGAGDYKDFPHDAYAFNHVAPIGPDDGPGGVSDASDAIALWSAGGGSDGPEGQLYALDQIADPADPQGIGWRADATKIVVWFGDAPGHDAVCSAISGLGYDITEASATSKLVDNDITVVAISTTTGGYAAGLDDDPTLFGGDYVGTCGVEGGTAGQATRIADATGGNYTAGIDASGIVDAIVDGVGAITYDITAQAVGCDPLDISWSPSSHEDVTGPTTVNFVETIAVPEDAEDGEINCVVEFLANGGVIATQEISVTIVSEIDVNLDVKPTSCPNPLSTNGGGLTPVAILGTADFDVADIDVSTVELEGVSPTHSSIEDVAAPYAGEISDPADREDCTTDGPDGFDDLTLKFSKADVVAALGPVEDGDVVVVTITGELTDGTAIVGQDVLWIVAKGS